MSTSCSGAESVWPELLLQSNIEQVSGNICTAGTNPAELRPLFTCSSTRCRRVSSPWNNRSPHFRPTWKALERPVGMGPQGTSLTPKRPIRPAQRQVMRRWRPGTRPLHPHPFLPQVQTQMPRGRPCPFPPPSDDCINLKGRNDFHRALNDVVRETEHFRMLIICWLTVRVHLKLFIAFCHGAVFLQILRLGDVE